MEMQAISLTAIKTALNNYLEQKGLYDTAVANLEGLGAKPALPQYVESNSDYNDAIAARNTWESDKALYTNQRNSYQNTMNTAADQVIEIIPPNTWIKIDTVGDGVTGDMWWCGYNTNTEITGYKPVLRTAHQNDEPTPPLTENM